MSPKGHLSFLCYVQDLQSCAWKSLELHLQQWETAHCRDACAELCLMKLRRMRHFPPIAGDGRQSI